MKKLFILGFLFCLSLFLVPQATAAVLVTQATVSNGDNWTVNYNNGQTFEFDLDQSGPIAHLYCKRTASDYVDVLLHSNYAEVHTSSGFSQFLGEKSVGEDHLKVICNNDTVSVYANGNLMGNVTDSSINVFSSNFVNNPQVDFEGSGGISMTNFSIADSENIEPTITSISVPTTTQLQNTPITITGEFTDINTQDTHTATIDWGDGTSSMGEVTESNGSGSVTSTHSYTTGGDFTISLTVTDQSGASVRQGSQIHINLSPIIYYYQSNGDIIYTANGKFSDSDSTSWTGLVNYGDGSGDEPLQIDEQNKTFSLSHTYTSSGIFPIIIKIIDDQGQISSPFSTNSNVLVTQSNISSGDNWTVNYNNGQTFEFDLSQSGPWAYLYCKRTASDYVYVLLASNYAEVHTSSGFSQFLGEKSVSDDHLKVICNNDTVSVYANGNLMGNVTDPSINVFSDNFVNNPQVSFVGSGGISMTNFSIVGNVLPGPTNTPTPIPTDIPTSTPTETPTPTNTPTLTPTPIPAYTLTGTVYNDANQNGFQDSGEQGVAGATVILNTGQTATTDSNGNYTFSNLESGTYIETLTAPSGYTSTTTNPVTVPLASDTTENFGIVIPTPTSTPTPTQAPTTAVTFDDISPIAPLNGEYKSVNWGTNNWDVDAAISSDNTHSASFHSSSATSETFSFDTPQVLISTDLESNSNQTALVTLSCSGNPTVSKQVAAGTTATVTTNWNTPCTTVTVTSSNGWNTNVDNIVYAASSNANPTPTPTPTGHILGNSSIGSQIDTGDTGFMNGSKFTTGATGGKAQSMSVFVSNIDNSTHSQYQMAIYTNSNGTPGTLVASTATGNLTALNWNTLPITATLQANTTYWLMYNTNSRTAQDLNNMYYLPGSQGAAAYAKHAFGSWPTNFPAATLDTPEFSLYVTYQ